MNNKDLFDRIQTEQKNVNFNDFIKLVEAFGFVKMKKKGKGSHSHQFSHKVYKMAYLNLQPAGKEAKPIQVRQFKKLVAKYNLTMEDE